MVGYRDAAGLEKAMAFVELSPGAERAADLEEQIMAYARDNIAAFKAPRRVEVVDALPRTETGKIRRAALREQAASSASTAGSDQA